MNLTDYFNGDVWKSVNLDEVLLKLTKEEVLYLHNYKEKFTKFGLHWTVLNTNEIKLHALPEAILGKNPRQVKYQFRIYPESVSKLHHHSLFYKHTHVFSIVLGRKSYQRC